ncbi:DUF3892 domain-containing protein [Micromonospora sp. CB01531]|uniref:DUF3892 domain-containing protein n=1 Tax=Micromonospora sp. CB01531 TaxID=1718947 RepID=UPI00093CAEA0|nr:DUF3892 domain-containing protein [Micromonospora sp. CB01531]OKI45494.1 hypothetical protein A6A27_38020 [Micromonospora sp. CB01531]
MSDPLPATPGQWRITHVVRVEHNVTAVAGQYPDGRWWRLSEADAVAAVRRGDRLYVQQPGSPPAEVVVVRGAGGREYLRTRAGGGTSDNLPSLPRYALSELLSHDTAHPFALLPVRIETRFAGTDLRVRVFPDQIHVDTHEPELTADEVAAGHRYWTAVWHAGTDPTAQAAAWDDLLTRLPAERAAWVARCLEPLNPGDRPTTTVPPTTDLNPAPRFPTPASRTDTWTRAPRAAALPDRWHVVAIVDGPPALRLAATSAPVRKPLAIAPGRGFHPGTLTPDTLPVDAATRWLVDYEEARAAGMAVTLSLAAHPELLTRGIDRLLVYGVRENPDPQAAARELADLLETHQHTHGLTYVPQGTPTNQTATATRVPGRRSPERAAAQRVTDTDRAPTDPQANAAVLAAALGLAVDSTDPRPGPTRRPGPPGRPLALARAVDATRDEQAQARAMNTLLWPATWGGFLWQQMHPMFTDAAITTGRRHFQAYVRASGPLPAVRVGDQPYGILPITPLAAWRPTETPDLDPPGIPPSVVDFLGRLRRDVWRPALTALPHVAGHGPDPQETVLRILGMAPTAQQIYGRSLLGMEYFANLWRFADLNLDENWRAQLRDSADALRARLGLPGWNPRVGQAVFATNSFPIDAPTVAAATGPTAAQYLTDIATATPEALQARRETVPAGQTPLLYRLARHAMLTEYAMAAARVLNRQTPPPPAGEHLDPELSGILPGRTTVTLWERLTRTVRTPSGATRTLTNYLMNPEPGDPATTALADLRTALTQLAALPPDTLDRLVRETLPLASHRLDAWLTSLATRRLRWMRSRNAAAASGIHLGAYAWVENLRPRPTRKEALPRPAGEDQQPLYRQPDNAGFIHAPSIGQATTAAVLRAAHRAHATTAGGPLAVDLPSRRVRLAAWLLDGLRQGQPLGALLGYRFERALQEHPVGTLAAYLDDFRALAPVRGTRVAAGEPPQEAVAATDVVDGLALHRLWRSGRLDLDTLGLDARHPAERDAAQQVLRHLDDAVDALADALLAESVHHAVQGQPLRAAATLDATSGGDSPAPELEGVRTPRTGTAVTHRVVVALGDPTPAPGWPVDATQTRQAAEPRLDAWLSRLLPTPDRVRCRVRVDQPDGSYLHRLVDLAPLQLSALDYVLMPEGTGQGQPTELEQHLIATLHARPEVGPRAGLTFDYARDPRWTPDAVTVPEFLEAVRAARALVTSARALEPRDLTVPEAPAAPVPTDQDLADRAAGALLALNRAAAALTDPARQHEGLRRATALGVPFAVPPAPDDTAEAAATLTRQTTSALAEVTRRRDLATAATTDRDRMTAVFGENFPIITAFTTTDPDAVNPPPAASTALLGGDPFAAVTWATRTARVRPGVQRLVATLSYADALQTGDAFTLAVAQRPTADHDRWLGLRAAAGTPPGSRISLVVHAAPQARSGPTAGLVVDEWTEVIPNAQETTAVAYHFDTPGASAPQAVLLAVPPDARGTWSNELIEQTLLEAMDLARLRLVDFEALHPIDPDALTDIGQFLPAAYFALNIKGDVVSTNFTEGK